MDLSGANVELSIGALRLEGFETSGQRVADALRGRLGSLILEGGLPEGFDEPLTLGDVDGGALELDPYASPEDIGAALAEHVYEGLGS